MLHPLAWRVISNSSLRCAKYEGVFSLFELNSIAPKECLHPFMCRVTRFPAPLFQFWLHVSPKLAHRIIVVCYKTLCRYPLMREKCFGAGSPLSSSREGRRRLGEPLPHQLADNRLPAQSTHQKPRRRRGFRKHLWYRLFLSDIALPSHRSSFVACVDSAQPTQLRMDWNKSLCASHLSSRQCCPFPRLYRSREGVAFSPTGSPPVIRRILCVGV